MGPSEHRHLRAQPRGGSGMSRATSAAQTPIPAPLDGAGVSISPLLHPRNAGDAVPVVVPLTLLLRLFFFFFPFCSGLPTAARGQREPPRAEGTEQPPWTGAPALLSGWALRAGASSNNRGCLPRAYTASPVNRVYGSIWEMGKLE